MQSKAFFRAAFPSFSIQPPKGNKPPKTREQGPQRDAMPPGPRCVRTQYLPPTHPVALCASREFCRRQDRRDFVGTPCYRLPNACSFLPARLNVTDQKDRGFEMRKVNAPAVSRADRLPSTAGGMTRLAYARAKAAGIALDPLEHACRQCGHLQAAIRYARRFSADRSVVKQSGAYCRTQEPASK